MLFDLFAYKQGQGVRPKITDLGPNRHRSNHIGLMVSQIIETDRTLPYLQNRSHILQRISVPYLVEWRLNRLPIPFIHYHLKVLIMIGTVWLETSDTFSDTKYLLRFHLCSHCMCIAVDAGVLIICLPNPVCPVWFEVEHWQHAANACRGCINAADWKSGKPIMNRTNFMPFKLGD